MKITLVRKETGSTIHQCPLGDSGVTSCCGVPVFYLPRLDRLTLDPALVTCGLER